MTKHKLYILSCDANLTFKRFRTHPVDFAIKAIIKIATWSNINHVADNYSYAGCGKLVNQAVPTGYESINYMKFFEQRGDSTIYAHEVKVPIDHKKWHEDTKAMRGRGYDLVGTILTKVYNIPILRKIFARDPHDIIDFCSEAVVEKSQKQGYVGNIKNKNYVHPKRMLRIIKRYDLCEPPFIVWKDGKMVKNIFEGV